MDLVLCHLVIPGLQQKRRLIQATAIAVASKGYAGATVADIIAIAGVSRSTFYALFKDKSEACMRAVFRP